MSKLSDFFDLETEEERNELIKKIEEEIEQDSLLVLCPYCKDRYHDSYWSVGSRDNCSWCNGKGVVSQKRRMEYVRQFIGMSKEDKWFYFRARESVVDDD